MKLLKSVKMLFYLRILESFFEGHLTIFQYPIGFTNTWNQKLCQIASDSI